MASKRFDNRKTFLNASGMYREQFTDRNVNYINQYNTPEFKDLEADEILSLSVRNHIWKTGDKFFKLAYQAYGTTKLWWIIPWFNQKPLESDFKRGDIVSIPFPLSDVLNLFYSRNI